MSLQGTGSHDWPPLRRGKAVVVKGDHDLWSCGEDSVAVIRERLLWSLAEKCGDLPRDCAIIVIPGSGNKFVSHKR